MAKLSNVDAAKIRSTAQKLGDIEAEIRTCVGKINDAISALDKGWQSEVKAQFMGVWQEDAEALCEMMEQYAEVQELLQQAAQDFERTEENMTSHVRKLRV